WFHVSRSPDTCSLSSLLCCLPSVASCTLSLHDALPILNLAYRWFLGYGLLEEIPHFSTVSYAFCHRFPEDLTIEIFEHILNKARSEEHTSELQSRFDLVCRLLLEKKNHIPTLLVASSNR